MKAQSGNEHGRRELAVERFAQPDDVTCGPTCLLSVLRFFGDPIPFEKLLEATPTNPDGGTLAIYLGLVALRLGYMARIHSYNLRILDPTWSDLSSPELKTKLLARAAGASKPKVKAVCRAYAEFLEAGGELDFSDLTPGLFVSSLERGHPILCGLSATYLYQQPRERPEDNEEDDVLGEPVGHFLVVCGHEGLQRFSVRDPATRVPESTDGAYHVEAQRLINAILLGVVSYDAVLLEIWPKAVPQ